MSILSRRNLLSFAVSTTAAISGLGQDSQGQGSEDRPNSSDDWYMPEEGDSHARTWMSFGASQQVWGRRLIDRVRADLATVVETIAKYEPVVLCVRPNELELVTEYIEDLTNINFFETPLNDLWIRDYGAVFVVKECETELQRNLGIKKVIWLPGVKGADITDGHTDFYARFSKPGVVVAHLDNNKSSSEYKLTRRHLEILRSSTDANKKRLKVVPINAPTRVRPRFESEEFCAGYINFYVCNDAVICPQFGDKRADGAAREILADVFPKRKIEMLNIDGIAAGGGGIHCATQQEPDV